MNQIAVMRYSVWYLQPTPRERFRGTPDQIYTWLHDNHWGSYLTAFSHSWWEIRTLDGTQKLNPETFEPA